MSDLVPGRTTDGRRAPGRLTGLDPFVKNIPLLSLTIAGTPRSGTTAAEPGRGTDFLPLNPDRVTTGRPGARSRLRLAVFSKTGMP